MFFPLRHDRRLRSTPWLTIALIVLNTVVFLLTAHQVALASVSSQLEREEWWKQFPILQYYLWPKGNGFVWWQLFSSAFLHADFMHLAGNMFFLWIFGGAVEDRLGKIGFACFYAAGAAAAGGLYLLTAPLGPVLGASGAIAAVSGAFLVLFPQVRVQIVYWFFMIGSFELPAMWVILGYFGLDIYSFLQTHGSLQGGGVAYAAHIGGFVLGFFVALLLLATKILAREPQWDLLAMFSHWRRREHFKSVAKEGSFWRHDTSKMKAKNEALALPPLLLAQRENIFFLVKNGQAVQAAEAYCALLDEFPSQVLPEQMQHDLAGLLMQSGAHAQAAQAFRLLLTYYPKRADHTQTQLLLALLCQRYLDKNDEAQALLKEALPKLEGSQKALAQSLMV